MSRYEGSHLELTLCPINYDIYVVYGISSEALPCDLYHLCSPSPLLVENARPLVNNLLVQYSHYHSEKEERR